MPAAVPSPEDPLELEAEGEELLDVWEDDGAPEPSAPEASSAAVDESAAEGATAAEDVEDTEGVAAVLLPLPQPNRIAVDTAIDKLRKQFF